MKKNLLSRLLHWFFLILILTAIVAGSIFLLVSFGSVQQILDYTPSNIWLAGVFFVLFYWIICIIIIFPIATLYVASGLLFSIEFALLINLIGIIGNVTIAFLLARHIGEKKISSLIKKYPKIQIFFKKFENHQWFLAFILRIINVLPVSAVSIVMGSTRISYFTYLTATLCGLTPSMIALTYMGNAVQQPSSPEFIISLSITIVLSVSSILFYRVFNKRW